MKKLGAFFLILLPSICVGGTVIDGIRTWPAPDNTRLVFDIDSPVDYRIFTLSHPERLVIDFKNTRLNRPLSAPTQKDTLIREIRSAPRNGHDLRVVLDLEGRPRYKSFSLAPYQDYGHRLVVDLYKTASARQKEIKKSVPAPVGLRDVVIAIDAGHGGEDPGAHGRNGTKEKDVVLAIARRLNSLVKKERGMRPVMIRDGDYFLSLRQRTQKARKQQADFFVSIHADSFKDPHVSGMSVYALSKNGATSEAARWLAAKENASDLIGGVSLDDKDDLLASVLLDLSQTGTIEASFDAGQEVLRNMKPIGKLHKRQVQQAGFVVLKSPDIPSILIETAYISNPEEERKLRSTSHQEAMADAILSGIRSFFAKNPPPGTLYAARQHIIVRGDTLSDIAQRYNVSTASLRNVNHLTGDNVRVGQVLRIPAGSDS